jgi:Xylose isomerase-like TIM barrel
VAAVDGAGAPRRYPLGIVFIAFGAGTPIPEAAARARDLGFDHIDIPVGFSGDLPLPVGDRVAFPWPQPGCSCPALPPGPDARERMLRAFRAVPTALLEPWAGSALAGTDAVLAFLDEVPGLRLLVDTGHVTCWGGDPCDLLPYAGHVQLRQARRGVNQARHGDVDFARLFDRLDELAYPGLLSIEYFDLPDRGAPLDDPLGHAVALAEELRPLLSRT